MWPGGGPAPLRGFGFGFGLGRPGVERSPPVGAGGRSRGLCGRFCRPEGTFGLASEVRFGRVGLARRPRPAAVPVSLVREAPVATGVPALEVYTPKEIFVANGTQGKLTCKFKSANTTGTSTSVSWSFQPEGTDTTVSFFHYSQGQVYPGNYPPFKDRTSWAGDLDKKDASINIENMQFIHNGTYICDVKNPPDIVAQPGHIRLYVVEKEVLPVFPVWVVVGIVAAVVLGLTLLVSTTLAVLYRRRNSKQDYMGCSTSESASPLKEAPRKSPSDAEGLVKSLPSGSHQAPSENLVAFVVTTGRDKYIRAILSEEKQQENLRRLFTKDET
ncbi:myelin protein zero-like protein 1 isoform X1 [Mustela erminea]|uniref:myelin protein zero-like protein 1 isoform X1 n=1 Tax=Mustela erminea TaxID=36723 RepID=UPI00138764DB|nr:myelin protein zero-like protein 1 isoform X1 [Mustela erminea]